MAEGLERRTDRLGREAFEVLLELLPPRETFWEGAASDPIRGGEPVFS